MSHTITIRRKRNFGAEEIEIEMDCFVENTADAFIQAGALLSTMDKVFEHYQAEHLQKVKPTGSQSERIVTKDFVAERLIPHLQDGKRGARVKGGTFGKWGVPIYEEVLTQHGHSFSSLPADGLNMVGWIATAEMEGGKPKRVIGLRKVDAAK